MDSPSLLSLDTYLPGSHRSWIEERFYSRVTSQANFETLLNDPGFWDQSSSTHVALYSDHGVVHVRDIALQTLKLFETLPGLLISDRSKARLEWMKGYAVTLIYLHDIGMADFSKFGRAVHAEYAAQAVFSSELDDWVDAAWCEVGGRFVGRIESLSEGGVFASPLNVIARELFALAVAHSKSSVPATILNDPVALRTSMLRILGTPLSEIYQRRKPSIKIDDLPQTPIPPLRKFYDSFQEKAYSWLLIDTSEAFEFVHDVVDTARVIRCADALRQRGTVQKTSGGYEVFANQQTGKAIFALRHGNGRLYLLEMEDKFSAGEANVASSEIDHQGNLRISFHLGAFVNEAALETASECAAHVINDIKGDVIDSFELSDQQFVGNNRPSKSASDIQILLENTPDRPDFVIRVISKLEKKNPQLANPLHIVPSLKNSAHQEIVRYLEAADFDWSLSRRRELLKRVAEGGHLTGKIDPLEGLRHVRYTIIKQGETLIEAGDPPGFVYLPLAEGLRIFPLGGYPDFSVEAWMPLGITGVIRGAIRNADVKADCDVPTLIIPQEVYMDHWHHTYTLEELAHTVFDQT